VQFLFAAVSADPVLVISNIVTHPTMAFLHMKSELDLPILGKLLFLEGRGGRGRRDGFSSYRSLKITEILNISLVSIDIVALPLKHYILVF
jgi:hypothetical protein